MIHPHAPRLEQPVHQVPAEEQRIGRLSRQERRVDGDHHHRDHQRELVAPQTPPQQVGRPQPLVQRHPRDHGERQKAQHQQKGGERSTHERCQPQCGQETDHHGRQGAHDLEGGLDVAPHARMHEAAGVHGTQHAQRRGEEHPVEGALQRAEDQRHQAQLGLELVRGPRGLPHVGGLAVALVPELAEVGGPRHLRVLHVQVPDQHLAARIQAHQPVRAVVEAHGDQRPVRLQRQQGALRGDVIHVHGAVGIPADQHLGAHGGGELLDHAVMAAQLVHAVQPQPFSARVLVGEPGAETAGVVRHDQGALPDQQAQGRNAAAVLPGRNRLQQRRGLRVAEVPAQDVAGGGAGVEHAAVVEERQRGDAPRRSLLQREDDVLGARAPEQGGGDDLLVYAQAPVRQHLRHGEAVVLGVARHCQPGCGPVRRQHLPRRDFRNGRDGASTVGAEFGLKLELQHGDRAVLPQQAEGALAEPVRAPQARLPSARRGQLPSCQGRAVLCRVEAQVPPCIQRVGRLLVLVQAHRQNLCVAVHTTHGGRQGELRRIEQGQGHARDQHQNAQHAHDHEQAAGGDDPVRDAVATAHLADQAWVHAGSSRVGEGGGSSVVGAADREQARKRPCIPLRAPSYQNQPEKKAGRARCPCPALPRPAPPRKRQARG